MKAFYEFLKFIAFRIKVPQPFGIFHIVCLFLTAAITIVLSVYCRRIKESTFKKGLFWFWIVLIILEVYKQLQFSFQLDSSNIENSKMVYQWYAFPYQFCATPLIVFPIFIFINEDNKISKFIKESVIGYIISFVLFGGLAVMFYPIDVFTSSLGICIHTMVHHGGMVVLGIFVFVYYYKRINILTLVKGFATYGLLVLIAMILNLTLGQYVKNIGQTFNMFFISPYYPCTLPVLGGIKDNTPYIVFLFIYVFGFILVASIVYFIQVGISKLILLKNKPNKN